MPPDEDALVLTPVDGGVLLSLRVSPGASREGIRGIHGDRLKVAVRTPPERGRANASVVSLLEDAFSLGRGRVELRAGATSHDKTVFVPGIAPEELRNRIHLILVSAGKKRGSR